MDEVTTEKAPNAEQDIAKKVRKAEIKAAEKARKAAKAEKKLAKQAEKSAKEAEKVQRKIEKQHRKDAEDLVANQPVDALKPPTPKAQPVKLEAADAKAKGVAAKAQTKPATKLETDRVKAKVSNAAPVKLRTSNAKAVSAASMSLGAKLQAVARLARSSLAVGLLKHGLYAGQEQVLFLLDEHGPLALAELADKLDVRAPTITKTVTRMEAQGFLSRAVSRDDARSTIIALAPEGRRVLKIGRQIVLDVETKTFFVLSETDCQSLEKHLDLVFSHLKQAQ